MSASAARAASKGGTAFVVGFIYAPGGPRSKVTSPLRRQRRHLRRINGSAQARMNVQRDRRGRAQRVGTSSVRQQLDKQRVSMNADYTRSAPVLHARRRQFVSLRSAAGFLHTGRTKCVNT